MHGPGHPAGMFFRKLALLIGSGVPLAEALDAVAQGFGGPPFGPRAEVAARMRAIVQRIAEDVRRTGKLSLALEAHPELFMPDLVAIVRSGESAGNLDHALMKIVGAVEDGTLRVGRKRFGLPGFLRQQMHAVFSHHHHGPHGPPPHPPPQPPPAPAPAGADTATTILRDAVRARASDVHVEPLSGGGRVRLRVDGQLREHTRLDAAAYARLVRDLKTFTSMDHAETRLPQEAHQSLEVDGKSIQFRFATSPYMHGEGITARMLVPPDSVPRLDQLGFSDAHRETLKRWLARPYGIIAATGPTGSGKTTTLLSLMASYDATTSKIVSVEQPVVMLIDGVNQLSLKPELGLTWETAVRAQLKHDPDVVAVAEVPSPEVAQLILNIALTGHVVLTCLHADSVTALFERLTAIGLEPALFNQAITGVIAQRLVRFLCPDCKERVESPSIPAGAERLIPELPPGTYFRPRGCPKCQGSGYRNRIAVYELADPSTVGRHRPLLADALDKAASGMTSLDEIIRTCLF